MSYPTTRESHTPVTATVTETQAEHINWGFAVVPRIEDYVGLTSDTADASGSLTSQILELRVRFGAPPLALNAVTTDSTAGARTWTAAELLGGLLLRDPNGAARTDVLPTAALLVAELDHPAVGQVYPVVLRNTADADETVTLSAGSGGTLAATFTIAQGETRAFLVRLTNVSGGTETYTVYAEVALRVPVQDIRDTGGVPRFVPNPTAKTIVDGSPTSLADIACASGAMCGGTLTYLVEVSDGTNHQALSGLVTYAAVNKAGTLTLTITEVTGNQAKAVSSGTLTLAWTFVTGSSLGTIQVQPTGSLTETTYRITYTVLPIVGAVTLL